MNIIENWTFAPGYEGRYEVSTSGQVRSVERKVWLTNRWGERMQRTVPAKFRTPSVNRSGYLYVTLHPGRKHWFVHQLVMATFVGPRPDGMVIRHADGNCTNNALSNLSYGTVLDNNRDTLKHGTHHQANKTHCKQGHPFDETNTYVRPDGKGRSCRICMKMHGRKNGASNQRAYRARKKAERGHQ